MDALDQTPSPSFVLPSLRLATAETARIGQPRRIAPEHVQLGSTVHLRRAVDGRESVWFIAGFEDGDPTAGRISYTAPLASALIGAEAGDVRVLSEGGQ